MILIASLFQQLTPYTDKLIAIKADIEAAAADEEEAAEKAQEACTDAYWEARAQESEE
jgi:hypothetical protein